LYHLLIRLGYRVHKDSYDVAASQNIGDRLRDLIADSDLVVTLLTSEAIASRWISMELDFAAALRKPILPVELEPMADEIARSVPHVSRDSIHWADAKRGYAALIEHIEQAISEKKVF
ncbi:toll/interleukin-1 receptor domain-containing protein, partial [Endothiovibrio diazotrophicus]